MSENVRNTDLIVVIDKKGKILYYNNFNDKINKLKDYETVGKNISDVYSWVNKDTPLFKVMKKRSPIVNQVMNITIDNQNIIRAINSAYPLIGPDGVIGSIGFSTSTNKNLPEKKKYNSFSAKYDFKDIITADEEMLELIKYLKKTAKFNSNIFIFGESGTGKELFAHSIHNASYRSNKPIVIQNCGAIPENLMESTLFGTKKGAFTGAEDRTGVFDIAEGGTLFLDEIDSLPLDLQPKLLRVLEDGYFRRVGGNTDIKSDVRIITATNMNREELLDKSIREDLFFRLSVINIKIPPLRDRRNDMHLLIKHFTEHYNHVLNKSIKDISSEASKVLNNYNWPGNVRELRNVLESSFINSNEDIILKEDLPNYIHNNIVDFKDNTDSDLNTKVENYEKGLIIDAIKKNKYNIVKTAEYLNIPRQTLYYKLNKYNINR